VTVITAYIGLGSNLVDPRQQLVSAQHAIAALPQVQVVAVSSFYRSPPLGPQDQPDYLNAVLAIQTDLPALRLLRELQAIEQQQGRVRTGLRWGARTLDLDLLLYGEHRIVEPTLIVPHPGLAERAFVLYPLYEIAPTLVIPGLGAIAPLLVHCPLAGLIKLT
jgi:2-amino-4-hydroxy-6-hydroxymethyldihydropteridine diphosphokinase